MHAYRHGQTEAGDAYETCTLAHTPEIVDVKRGDAVLSLGQERRQSDCCREYSPHKRAIARHRNRNMKCIYVCACIRQVREQIGAETEQSFALVKWVRRSRRGVEGGEGGRINNM
jgi:hypothetical protein